MFQHFKVCVSVCVLVTTVRPAEVAEPTKMLFRGKLTLAQGDHLSDGAEHWRHSMFQQFEPSVRSTLHRVAFAFVDFQYHT